MVTNELKNIAIEGTVWLTVQSILTKGGYFVISILLARMLYPADFGIFATALLIISIFNIFAEAGIGLALVQNKETDVRIQSVGFWLTLFLGIASFFCVIIISPLISDFFNESALNLFLPVMAFDLLLTSLEVVPVAFFNKNLRFRVRFWPETIFVITYGLVALTLSSKNFGVWSLVIGVLVSHGVRTILYWVLSRIKISFVWDGALARDLLKYGYHAVGASLILTLLINGDNGVVRKLLDNASLGYYTLAYGLASLPATHLTHIFGTLTFPLYSKLQDDAQDFSRAFSKILQLITSISIPTSFGILVLAPYIVNIIYGEKWSLMIVPLQILSIFGMLRSILSVCGNVFYAINKHNILKKIMFVQLIVMAVTIFPLTKKWGIIGTAISVNVAQVLAMILIFLFISKFIKGGISQHIKSLLRTLLASAVMVVSIYAIISWGIVAASLAGLLFFVCFGAFIYFVSLWFINREISEELIKFIKDVWKQMF